MTDSTATSSSGAVSVVSSELVLPSQPELSPPRPPPTLGPLDALVPAFIPVKVVFVYQQPRSASAELIPLARLRAALSALLGSYPQLSAKLTIDQTGANTLEQSDTGAQLVSATSSLRLDDKPQPLSMIDLPGQGNGLFAPFAGDGSEGVFSVQHTTFACGAVALGVRVQHAVCDAEGLFLVISDLASLFSQLARGEEAVLVVKPAAKAFLTKQLDDDARKEALSSTPSHYHLAPDADEPTPVTETEAAPAEVVPAPSAPAPNVGRFLRFSARELAAIKQRATPPEGTPNATWISTFDALAAHLYHRTHLARLKLRENDPSLGELSPPDFLTPVNVRTRLGADFPSRYSYNALIASTVCPEDDVLAGDELWPIAQVVHALTRTADFTSPSALRHSIAWLSAQGDKSRVQTAFRYGTGSFMVSQWNKLDWYGSASFGGVEPSLVSTPFTPISELDGLTYFLPSKEGEGIEVCMSVMGKVWEVLEGDEMFRL